MTIEKYVNMSHHAAAKQRDSIARLLVTTADEARHGATM